MRCLQAGLVRRPHLKGVKSLCSSLKGFSRGVTMYCTISAMKYTSQKGSLREGQEGGGDAQRLAGGGRNASGRPIKRWVCIKHHRTFGRPRPSHSTRPQLRNLTHAAMHERAIHTHTHIYSPTYAPPARPRPRLT